MSFLLCRLLNLLVFALFRSRFIYVIPSVRCVSSSWQFSLQNFPKFMCICECRERGITLDIRLPFPDSVLPGPATIQKVYQGINGFPSWRGYNRWWFRASWVGLREITGGDWHSGRPARLLRSSLLTEGKILSKHEELILKHNCNVKDSLCKHCQGKLSSPWPCGNFGKK